MTTNADDDDTAIATAAWRAAERAAKRATAAWRAAADAAAAVAAERTGIGAACYRGVADDAAERAERSAKLALPYAWCGAPPP